MRHRHHHLDGDTTVASRFNVYRGAQQLEAMLEMCLLEPVVDHRPLGLDGRGINANPSDGRLALDIDIDRLGNPFREDRCQNRLNHPEQRHLHRGVDLDVVLRPADRGLDAFDAAKLIEIPA